MLYECKTWWIKRSVGSWDPNRFEINEKGTSKATEHDKYGYTADSVWMRLKMAVIEMHVNLVMTDSMNGYYRVNNIYL